MVREWVFVNNFLIYFTCLLLGSFTYPQKLLATKFFHHFGFILKGKVVIAAKSGVKLEIPDGAVLENKVKKQRKETLETQPE